MQNETWTASAVKAGAMTAGAAMSGMPSVEHVATGWGQLIIWTLTVAYGVLQIVKAMPWFTDQARAFWQGVRHGDWSRWWAIARRGEKSDEGGK